MESQYGINNYLKSILCGGLSGMFVDIVLFPLDTIKTRIQATIKGQSIDYKNTVKVSKYSGLRSQIYASFPAAAAFFSTYDLTKYVLFKKFNVSTKYETLVHMTGAVLGEMAQVVFRNPFELIKQNMQLGKYNTVGEAMLDIYKSRGIMGLYKGYFITVLREIPFGIIQYPLYEYFKKRRLINKKESHENLTTSDFCISGMMAGGISAFITTPIDVIKTRIMTQNKFNINQIIRNIYLEEGLGKFFSGVHVRVTYISIGGTIFFGTNEVFKKFLGYKNI